MWVGVGVVEGAGQGAGQGAGDERRDPNVCEWVLITTWKHADMSVVSLPLSDSHWTLKGKKKDISFSLSLSHSVARSLFLTWGGAWGDKLDSHCNSMHLPVNYSIIFWDQRFFPPQWRWASTGKYFQTSRASASEEPLKPSAPKWYFMYEMIWDDAII